MSDTPLNQRLRDLVRYMRGDLFRDGLITQEEFTELAGEHGAVKRLEDYDKAIKHEFEAGFIAGRDAAAKVAEMYEPADYHQREADKRQRSTVRIVADHIRAMSPPTQPGRASGITNETVTIPALPVDPEAEARIETLLRERRPLSERMAAEPCPKCNDTGRVLVKGFTGNVVGEAPCDCRRSP